MKPASSTDTFRIVAMAPPVQRIQYQPFLRRPAGKHLLETCDSVPPVRDSFVRTDSSCGSHFRSLLCQFLFRLEPVVQFVPFFSSSLLEHFEGASANLLMQRRCNFV